MRGLGGRKAGAALALAASLLALIVGTLGGEAVVCYRERQRDTVPGTISMLYYQHRRLGHALVVCRLLELEISRRKSRTSAAGNRRLLAVRCYGLCW